MKYSINRFANSVRPIHNSLVKKYKLMKVENANSGSPFAATKMWNSIIKNIEREYFKTKGISERLKLVNKSFTHSNVGNPRYYDYATTLLYNYLVFDGAKSYLDKLELDFELDVRTVNLENKKFNWDILTAFYVLWKIRKKIPDLFTNEDLVIAELGSGYGKHAQILSLLNRKIRFLCFDLPLPLLVADEVLNLRISHVPINSYPLDFTQTFNPKLLNEGIYLFGSHHLSLISDESIDIFINTSSFQEMTKNQVSSYLQIVSRKCNGIIFLQNYWKHKNQSKTFGNILGWEEYVFPDNMHLESLGDCHYSSRYFDAILTIKIDKF